MYGISPCPGSLHVLVQKLPVISYPEDSPRLRPTALQDGKVKARHEGHRIQPRAGQSWHHHQVAVMPKPRCYLQEAHLPSPLYWPTQS